MAANASGSKPGPSYGAPSRMDRLSKVMEKEFGVELTHEALIRLGYKAEKKPNNPNTYYTVPGAAKVLENTPKVIAYIREQVATKEGAWLLLGSTKHTVNRRVPAPAAVSSRRLATMIPVSAAAATDAGGDDVGADQDVAAAAAVPQDIQAADNKPGSSGSGKPVLEVPSGFTPATPEKTTKVLEGMAQCIALLAHSSAITADSLRAKGMTVVEDSRPATPGERMRHPWVWWAGKLSTPVRCAQYMFCVKAVLDVDACREALGMPLKTHKTAAGAAASGSGTAALQRKRSSEVLTPPAGQARNAAAAAVAAAVKRTRTSAATADAPAAATAAAQDIGKVTTAPLVATAGRGAHSASQRGRRPSHGSTAAASPSRQHVATIPSRQAADGAAAVDLGGAPAAAVAAQPPAIQPASPSGGGRVRGAQGRYVPRTSAAGAAGDRQLTAAAAENQKVLANVDDVVQQLGEALSIAGGFSPSVLSSMPAVFTAGVAGPLQAFLSQGTPRHHALAEDRETCSMILADYAPDQPYRKTYLAFRAALEAEATAAAAWLHEDQQQVMLDKLRVLSEFKQRLEEQRRNEEQARLREEALRKKELELQAAMEQLQRERDLMAQEKERQKKKAQEEQQQQAAESDQQQQQQQQDHKRKPEEAAMPAVEGSEVNGVATDTKDVAKTE